MWREIERSYPRGTERGWILYWSFRDEEQRDQQLEKLKALMPDRRWRSNSAPATAIRRIWYPDLVRKELTPAQKAALERGRAAPFVGSPSRENPAVDAL
jgi:hypothetical protein